MTTDQAYREAVRWIADNDEDSEMSVPVVEFQMTVCMVAEVFGREHRKVAEAVVARRRRRT